MSNKKPIDLPQMKSSTNLITRSKKLPPPPLCLPASNTTVDEEERQSNVNQQIEQNESTTICRLSSSSKDCSHEHIPYTLPIGQRSQILETLINSSSSLLAQPTSETKQKRSQISFNTINVLKQHQASRQGTVKDTEWMDFIRFIIHKPLESELRMLLDKYKTTYFDRVNSPNISDATIRTILCDMVSEILTGYSSTSNDIPTNVPSSLLTASTNGTSKRKRSSTNIDISEGPINNQTKFVISYIIPGKYDNTIINSNKITSQQQHKQFQKKYSHLFKYIPDKDEQTNLLHQGHLKNLSTSSHHNHLNNICLMLYDEVIAFMAEDDLELSGISIDHSFTLSESILTHIYSLIQ